MALSSSRLAWWDHDFVSGRVRRSPEWAAMLGYEPGEIGDGLDVWIHLIHRDDVTAARETATRHETGQTQDFEVEHRLRARDGQWRWVLNRGRIVERSASGSPIRAVGTHMDITRRKTAELSREVLISRLEASLAELKAAQDLIAICSWCKKVRGDEGQWQQIESSLGDKLGLRFTHSLCPQCATHLRPPTVPPKRKD